VEFGRDALQATLALLTASSGPERRNRSAILSCGVSLAAVDQVTVRAAIAVRVCLAIACMMPDVAFGSKYRCRRRDTVGRLKSAAVVAITRQTGIVGDERGARLRQPVEQRRLPTLGRPTMTRVGSIIWVWRRRIRVQRQAPGSARSAQR
jgi:hypothetical protein